MEPPEVSALAGVSAAPTTRKDVFSRAVQFGHSFPRYGVKGLSMYIESRSICIYIRISLRMYTRSLPSDSTVFFIELHLINSAFWGGGGGMGLERGYVP